MKTLIIPVIFLLIFLPNEQCSGQATPEQLVPFPGFAEYQPEMSRAVLDLALQMEDMNVMEGSMYNGSRQIRYEAVDMDVRVYTTARPIQEVRDLYFDMIFQSMQPEGVPPEALEQLKEFIEYEVMEEIETAPIIDFDLDMMEDYYREAGLTEIVKWIGCYRDLQPQITDKVRETFAIEMNELQFHRMETVEDEMNFYIVEVEVEQPFIDVLDCSVKEETVIMYNIYRMVVMVD